MRHIARRGELFVEFQEKVVKEHIVYMGNNTYCDALREGKCKFSINESVSVIKNVLYVPSIHRNLLFVLVLDKKRLIRSNLSMGMYSLEMGLYQ